MAVVKSLLCEKLQPGATLSLFLLIAVGLTFCIAVFLKAGYACREFGWILILTFDDLLSYSCCGSSCSLFLIIENVVQVFCSSLLVQSVLAPGFA